MLKSAPKRTQKSQSSAKAISVVPNLIAPSTIFDLLNFRIAEFFGLSGSLVTRLCEGQYGITREAWQFIAMLAALGPMSPSELAAKTTVDRSQVSKTLQTLSAKKLISRQIVPSDARRITISLNESGRTLYEKVFPKVVEVHHSVIIGLTENEKKVLAKCLVKMQQGAQRALGMGLVNVAADRRHGGSRVSWPGV